MKVQSVEIVSCQAFILLTESEESQDQGKSCHPLLLSSKNQSTLRQKDRSARYAVSFKVDQYFFVFFISCRFISSFFPVC